VGDVRIDLGMRFNARKCKLHIGGARAGEGRSHIRQGVNAEILHCQENCMAKFSFPAGKANDLGALLAAMKVNITVLGAL
jgi:hypothetical protein